MNVIQFIIPSGKYILVETCRTHAGYLHAVMDLMSRNCLLTIPVGFGSLFGISYISPYLRDCWQGMCVAAGSISLLESLGIRIKEWYFRMQIFADHPLFGTGVGVSYQSFFGAPGRLVGELSGSSSLL